MLYPRGPLAAIQYEIMWLLSLHLDVAMADNMMYPNKALHVVSRLVASCSRMGNLELC